MVGDALATSSFWAGYGIFLGTLLIHEFGHASAACRYGSRPHDIGITVYLIYPAFYSNVSSVWKLRRWQRVVVDLAGTYFQFVAAAALLVGYAWTEWPPLRIAILLTIGTTVFSLNPVLKFDGYWLVADALGVTNLSKQPRRVLSAFWARLRDREAPPLPWSSTIVGILALYTVASIAIWSYFLVMIGQLFWGQLLSYPGMVSQFVSDGVDPSVTLDSARYHELFVSTYLSFIVVYLPGRLIWGFLPKLRDYAERLGEQIPFIASAPEPET